MEHIPESACAEGQTTLYDWVELPPELAYKAFKNGWITEHNQQNEPYINYE